MSDKAVAGPESIVWLGTESPAVVEAMRLVGEYKAAKDAISANFSASVKTARQMADRRMAELQADFKAKMDAISGVRHE